VAMLLVMVWVLETKVQHWMVVLLLPKMLSCQWLTIVQCSHTISSIIFQLFLSLKGVFLHCLGSRGAHPL
jgi:hypothetical protein